ncbi:MAG: efflux RND transporter periplasmic adaptor subunit [Nitrospirae bacterium]|nr:efflux RND transporter periplasmic adaptor subunit [Nitrospirota bacterium]
MSPQSTPERPDPLKVGIHDADLDGLAIQRRGQHEPRSSARTGRWRWRWLVVLIVLIGGALVVWETGLVGRGPSVEVASVVRMPAGGSSGLAATGYVVAQRQASIASKGTGRLEYLGVKVGDRVKEGQVIARLEHADIDALLQQMVAKINVAQAQLGAAKPELEDATIHFERVKTLLAKSFITKSEYDIAGARLRRAAAALKSAEASVMAAKAERTSVEVQLENTNIRAPFDGIVVKKLAEVGEVVSSTTASVRSGGSVASIVDPTSVMVDAEVSESMIHRVQAGQPVEIQLDSVPDHRYRGEVLQVMPIADRAKATILTRVRFLDVDERVRPELSAKVTFGVRPGTADTSVEEWGVPSSAVVTHDGRPVVLLVKEGMVVETVVQVGAPVGTITPVRGSFSQTDEVIMAPPADLRSGASVTVHRRTS